MTIAPIAILPINEIDPVYRAILSTERIERHYGYIMKNMKPPYFTVHLDQTGEYTLIEGIIEYETLFSKARDSLQACWVVHYENSTEKTYAILRRMLAYERTKWNVKYDLFQSLRRDHQQSTHTISKKLDIPLSTVNRFDLDERIPRKFIAIGIKNNAGDLLNKICRSRSIPINFKHILYNRVVLQDGDPARLTIDLFNWLTKVFNNLDQRVYSTITMDEFDLFLTNSLFQYRRTTLKNLTRDLYKISNLKK